MPEEKKSESKQRKEALFAKKKHGALQMTEEELLACESFSKDYMSFLNHAKTEREVCTKVESLLQEHGFVPFVPRGKATITRKHCCCGVWQGA